MTQEEKEQFIEDATAALQRAQEVARQRAQKFGTPFIVADEGIKTSYQPNDKETALVKEQPPDEK